MSLIRKIFILANPISRAGLLFTALAMLIAYPCLSFDSCPLEMKPRKSACGCGCGCSMASENAYSRENESSGCACGMADREANPSAPLNAITIGSPENLTAPLVEIPIVVEHDMESVGYFTQDLKPARSSLPLYIRHASLLI